MEKTTQNHLQGGEFLLRKTESTDIFSPEDFSEEQRMMGDTVTEFVDREIVPNKKRFEEHDYKLTEQLLRKAGKFGFLGITIPEKYGGLAMDFVTSIMVCDRISGATGSFATAFGAHSGIGTLPIALYGNDTQKQTYLPKLVTGEWIGSYALTEPGAGSDANSGTTSAKLSEDGKH